MATKQRDIVVAGFGSAHGDDQVGCRVAAMLRCRHNLPARSIAVYEATQLLDELSPCRKLIVVDACRTGGEAGAITRLRWPDPRIVGRHSHSSHGEGVFGALRLAEQLGRLPPDVDIIGIEVGDCKPIAKMSRQVVEAMIQAEAMISAELRKEEEYEREPSH